MKKYKIIFCNALILMLLSSTILPASVFAKPDSWEFPNGEAFNSSNNYTIEFANNLAILKPNIFVPEVEGAITSAFDAVVYDFDGDGDQDIYASSVGGFNQYYTNNGNKTFAVSTIDGDIQLQQTDNLTLGDFNGDDEMDIYVGNINIYKENFIWLGDGNGGFTKSEQAVGSDDTLDAAVADFDNDGDLDIVATSSLNQTDKVYLNQGGLQEGVEGEFVETALDAVINQYSQGVATGDVNGDNVPDLYIGTMSGGSQNKLFLGDGDGTFTPSNIAGDTSNVRSVAIGDIDNDTDNDIYVGVTDGPNFFWINDGEANFTQYFVPGDHEDTISVYLGDIDGDSDLDARSVGLNGPNKILINDGTGTFELAEAIPSDTSAWNTMYADFDNDGDQDILNLNTLTILYQGYDYRSPYIELKDSLMFGTVMNSFSEVTSINSQGTTSYQVSTDNGLTWYYYDEEWLSTEATDGTETSTALEISLNISALDTNGGQFLWRAYFNSDGEERVELESVTVDSTSFDHEIQITGSSNGGQWVQNTTNQLNIEISCLGVEDCVGIDTEVYSVLEDSREVSITSETEDCITDNVCFSMYPGEGFVLTNTVQDTDFSFEMPLGTSWSDSACGATPEELEYDTFFNVTNFSPTLATDYCVYLEDDETYMNINFSEYNFFDGLATYQRSGEFATLVPTEVFSPLYATDLVNPIDISTIEGGATQTISFSITNSAEVGSEYNFFAKTSLPFAPDVNEDSELYTVTIVEPANENNGGGGGGGSSSGSRGSKNTTADGSNYSNEVAKVMAEKIVTENPDGPANKCEALMMISRVFDWEVPTSTTSKYTDVPDWCVSLAAYGTTRGIVEGRTVTTLGLETPVTRNEVATMIYRELNKQSFKFTSAQTPGFTDTLTPWASEAILKLAAEGIIKGFSDGTFGGEKNILKKDLGVMLLRAKDRLQTN